MGKKMSLKTKNFIGSIVCGICWFVSGICERWDTTASKIVIVIALGCAVIAQFVEIFVRSDGGDEMSELHYLKSKARVYDMLIMTFLMFSVIAQIVDLSGGDTLISNWQGWLRMLVGVMQIICGIYFAFYEKRGDTWED